VSTLDAYEAGIQPAREKALLNAVFTTLLTPECPADTLELFLIHWCSLSVQHTRPVERWIRSAGERCQEMGLEELGRALVSHARHERGHEELFIADTRALVARWNGRRPRKLQAQALMARPPPQGSQAYIQLHEDIIGGAAPYAQLAVEYEIERMAMLYGPVLVRMCVEKLGKDILSCMTFVTEHAELDIGHTKFNSAQLEKLLAGHPEFLDALVKAGSQAHEFNGAFIEECIALAVKDTPALAG
jgi:hypothetical protein